VEGKPDAPSGVRKVTATTIRAEWNRMGFGRENGGGSRGESAVGRENESVVDVTADERW